MLRLLPFANPRLHELLCHLCVSLLSLHASSWCPVCVRVCVCGLCGTADTVPVGLISAVVPTLCQRSSLRLLVVLGYVVRLLSMHIFILLTMYTNNIPTADPIHQLGAGYPLARLSLELWPLRRLNWVGYHRITCGHHCSMVSCAVSVLYERQ